MSISIRGLKFGQQCSSEIKHVVTFLQLFKALKSDLELVRIRESGGVV